MSEEPQGKLEQRQEQRNLKQGPGQEKTQEPGQVRNARTTKRETAADVAQRAVNWAQMGKPNTNQPQMQEGAQPHRSSVRHGHDRGGPCYEKGPLPGTRVAGACG